MHRAICVVSGITAGLLIGFNGFLWSQAVIVEVYTLSVLSLALVLVFLLHYVYAPQQRRYLYWASFMFGICLTNHQTLIVAAMGIEVLIAAANPRLGRDAFFANSVLYVLGLIAMQFGYLENLYSQPALKMIFNLVGLGSIVACIWMTLRTEVPWSERQTWLVVAAGVAILYVVAMVFLAYDQSRTSPGPRRMPALVHLLGVAAVAAAAFVGLRERRLLTEWLPVVVSLAIYFLGASFYFFMPLTSATNPPLNWAYPRTWDGFLHAFTRGQYEKTNPTLDPGRIFDQVLMLFEGAVEEFNLVYLLLALLPFVFWSRLRKQERAWITGLTAIYCCLAFLLLWLLNPQTDRQSRELTRVFFTASNVIIAMGVGAGLSLMAAVCATQYREIRRWALIACAVAASIALFVVIVTFGVIELFPPDQPSYFFDIKPSRSPLVRTTALIALGLAGFAVALFAARRERMNLTALLALFALLPVKTALSHWSDNEQRGHLYGWWFGHDMFTPPFKEQDGRPLYPEMTRNAILFGGTDPGRFNPTYMIFCESFIPPRCKPRDPAFDRRDVYLITQNALADGTYLNYIRAHYNRTPQIPYDTPFLQEMLRPRREREKNLYTNALARAVAPVDRVIRWLGDTVEKDRRAGTSWLKPEDLTDPAKLAARLRPGPEQDAFSRHLSSLLPAETQQLLTTGGADGRFSRALARDINRVLEAEYEQRLKLQERLDQIWVSVPDPAERQRQRQAAVQQYRAAPNYLYRPEAIDALPCSDEVKRLLAQDLPTASRIRMGRRLMEEAYSGLIRKSPGGVYPELEIHTPSPEESTSCYNTYMQDAFQRRQLGQLRPGEDVREEGGRVTVSGQVAVMSINALLCKVIFDQNPGHEFFIEESFALDWMYPYLMPYGIIMKINREPMAALDEDILRRDHEFWRQYSNRLIGDWITNETPVKEICDFVEKVYIQRDFSAYKGDRKFIRDDNAQKAFSKLRSAIAGVYAWRVSNARSSAEQQRLIQEADFAFRQAFAFCPYSPEAVFRYSQLLATLGRFDDALLIARTCLRLDPFNSSVVSLVDQLQQMRNSAPALAAARNMLSQQEQEFRTNPGNVQNALVLAQTYINNQMLPQATSVLGVVVNQLEPQWRGDSSNAEAGSVLYKAYTYMRNPVKARMVLDRLVQLDRVDANTLLDAAQVYAQSADAGRLEIVLSKLVRQMPDSPEAWFDYAGVLAALNKPTEAIAALDRAIQLSDRRRATDSKANDLRQVVATDSRFNSLKGLPEFRKLLP